jgi:hypothetical protein
VELRNPFAQNEFSLETPVAPADVGVAILGCHGARLDGIRGRPCRLHIRTKRRGYVVAVLGTNDMRIPRLALTLEPSSGGTTVRGRFETPSVQRYVMFPFFVLCAAVCDVGLIAYGVRGRWAPYPLFIAGGVFTYTVADNFLPRLWFNLPVLVEQRLKGWIEDLVGRS